MGLSNGFFKTTFYTEASDHHLMYSRKQNWGSALRNKKARLRARKVGGARRGLVY